MKLSLSAFYWGSCFAYRQLFWQLNWYFLHLYKQGQMWDSEGGGGNIWFCKIFRKTSWNWEEIRFNILICSVMALHIMNNQPHLTCLCTPLGCTWMTSPLWYDPCVYWRMAGSSNCYTTTENPENMLNFHVHTIYFFSIHLKYVREETHQNVFIQHSLAFMCNKFKRP